jgi:RHS repeat-associated protein
MEIRGQLIAQGTATQKIWFTSNSATPAPGSWTQLFFKNTGPGDNSHESLVSHIVVEYSTYGFYQTLTHFEVQNSTFRHNLLGLIVASTPSSGQCYIHDNHFSHNVMAGIGLFGSRSQPPRAVINNNNFYGRPTNEAVNIYAVPTTETPDDRDMSDVTINADSNWWGTNDPVEAAGWIFDHADNPESLVVNVTNSRLEGYARSGGIDAAQTWTAAMGTMVVVGNLEVKNTGSLTIEPGVTVKFLNNGLGDKFSILNLGTLTANGLAGQEIMFTSYSLENPAAHNPGDWNSLYLAGGSVASLSYLDIQYGTFGILQEGVSQDVSESVLQNNTIGLLLRAGSSPRISRSRVINNQIGVLVSGSTNQVSRPVLHNNDIYGNTDYNLLTETTSGNLSGETIDAQNNWWGANDPAIIAIAIRDNTDSPELPQVDFIAYQDVSYLDDSDPPVVTAFYAPTANAAGWNNTDVAVSFSATDTGSGVATVTPVQLVTAEGGEQNVTGSATDKAGNSSTTAATVHIDKTSPDVAITSPETGTVIYENSVSLSGHVSDALSGVETVLCGTVTAVVSGSTFSCDVALSNGPNIITVTARDAAGNMAVTEITLEHVTGASIQITSPASLITVGASPIDVTGTVSGNAVSVFVNGVAATVVGGTFTVNNVVLSEGLNTIVASAYDALDNVTTASVNVTLDSTPPKIEVTSPANGAVVREPSITVTGLLNDIVRGTVNAQQGNVLVNGVQAVVSNRGFVAQGVVLTPGSNTITASGSDQAGNVTHKSITVTYDTSPAKGLRIIEGNNQSGVMGAVLPVPLTVELNDDSGMPMGGETVIFEVVENNGELNGNSRSVAVTTDANGRAWAVLTLGTWAGAGNNRVEVSAVGVKERVMFAASALTGAGAYVHVGSGGDQRGAINHLLPQPLVATVTDTGHNPVEGVPVTFTVRSGGGAFTNDANVMVVNTDSDGRATVNMILGPQEGNDTHRVQADIPGNAGLPAVFKATGLKPGNPGQTKISGVVLDNMNQSVPGVTVQVDGTTRSGVCDAEGHFEIDNVPNGPVHLVIEGSTATVPGAWPVLNFELTTIAGQNNTLGGPIYLLPINTTTARMVGGNKDVVYTLPEVPGFSLTVKANSVTFPDGSHEGLVSVTTVHMDKLPMAPPYGLQSRFVITVQPPGVVFDPPAALTLPNMDGLAPGEKTNLFSFDHDLGAFVSIGPGTVSEDGMRVVSDPGVGVIKAGWHCGANPQVVGICESAPDMCGGHVCDGDGEPPACGPPPECATNASMTPNSASEECEQGAPIEVKDGRFYHAHTDLTIPGRMPMVFQRRYDNTTRFNGHMGYGWGMSYHQRLYQRGSNIVWKTGENYDYVFTYNAAAGAYIRQGGFGEYDRLVVNADNSAVLTTKLGMEYHFASNWTLSRIEDPQGNQLLLTYDPAGELPVMGLLPSSPALQEVDRDDRLTRVEQGYNGTPSGRFVNLSYNTHGRLEFLTDFTGRQVRYVYDPSGNGDLVDVIDPEGNHMPYTYDSAHQMLTFQEENSAGCASGCSTTTSGLHTNTYDGQNRVILQEHGNNRIEFDYTNAPVETKVTTRIYDDTASALLHTRVEYYEYDALGRMTRYTRQMGSGRDTVTGETDDLVRTLTYNAQGWVTQRVMEDGTVKRYSYDGLGNVTSEMVSKSGEPTLVTGYTYEPVTSRIASRMVSSTADGQVFRVEYDYAGGQVTEERRYVDATTALRTDYTYTPQGDILTMSDPQGNTLQYEHNADGFMTRVFDPGNPVRETRFGYDALGNQATVRDANGRVTGFTYDGLRRILTTTNAKNEQTIHTYTGKNLTQIESGHLTGLPGLITRMYFDPLNRQERAARVTGTGEVTLQTVRYDSEGRVVTLIDANNFSTTSSYDVLGRLAATRDALGNTTSHLPDKAGNVIQTTDANANTTTQTYSTHNRLKTITQNDGIQDMVTQYTYDAMGSIRTVTDAEGRVTTHTYDGAGRLLEVRSPMGQTVRFGYDNNGNMTRRTDQNGRLTEYDYDAYNQLEHIYYGGMASAVKTVTFSYDNAGNMLTWSDGMYAGSYLYDELNRVISMRSVYPFGSRTIAYEYDRFGNRRTVSYPDGPGVVNYSYDDFNRLDQMTYGASMVDYDYDNAGRLLAKTLPNGVVTSYGYDAGSRVRSVVNRRSDSSVISSFLYPEHDNVGNIRRMTDLAGDHVYDYDEIYRLRNATHPSSWAESFTYDRAGNRLTDAVNSDWVYDANNRLQSYDGVSFTYDNNGNTLTRTQGTETRTFSYDYENRLETVHVGTLVVSYRYDPFGKRLSKTVGGVTTYYLYDEEDIVAEYDSSGNPTAAYIHGPGIDEPIEMTRGGVTVYYTADGLGSVRDLTDNTENIVEQYSYDSFGNLTTPPATGNPYTYTSREYDGETGLYFYRARYYDPKVGRFLTEDPIGFDGGDVNFYVYVAGNPVNFVDPSGNEIAPPLMPPISPPITPPISPPLMPPLPLPDPGTTVHTCSTPVSQTQQGPTQIQSSSSKKGQRRCRCTIRYLDDKLRQEWGCPDRVYAYGDGKDLGACQKAAKETAPEKCRKYYGHCGWI